MRTNGRLAVAFALTALLAGAEESRRLALVIGNNNYIRQPLKNAANDARAVHRTLTKIGYQSELVVDARRDGMMERIDAFLSRLRAGDSALIYYAGHAFQLQGENMLVPIDFDGAKSAFAAKNKSVPLGEVLNSLNQSPAAQKIVILDACRTNPAEGDAFRPGLAQQLTAAKETYIVFSTAPGTVAHDNPEDNNSVFTGALTDLLPTPGITIDELITRVTRRVQSATPDRQTPWRNGNLSRRFYFVPSNEVEDGDEPTAFVEYLRKAREHAQKANWEQCIEFADQVVRADPRQFAKQEATRLREHARLRMSGERSGDEGEFRAAAAYFKQALEADARDTDAAMLAADHYLLANDLPAAVKMLQHVRVFGNSTLSARANRMMRDLAEVSAEARAEMRDPNPRPPTIEQLGVGAWQARAFLDTLDGSPLRAGQLVGPTLETTAPEVIAAWTETKPDAAAEAPEQGDKLEAVVGALADAPADSSTRVPRADAGESAPRSGALIQIVPLSGTRDLIFREELPDPPVQQVASVPAGSYPVRINTAPSGADIVVEGYPDQRCTSPCVVHIAPGRRVINISKRGYIDNPKIVQMKPNFGDINVQLALRAGTLAVQGVPDGTPIIIDNRDSGIKAPQPVSLPEGRYEVRFIEGARMKRVLELDIVDGRFARAKMD